STAPVVPETSTLPPHTVGPRSHSSSEPLAPSWTPTPVRANVACPSSSTPHTIAPFYAAVTVKVPPTTASTMTVYWVSVVCTYRWAKELSSRKEPPVAAIRPEKSVSYVHRNDSGFTFALAV